MLAGTHGAGMLLCLSLVLQVSIGLADTGSEEDSGSTAGGDTAVSEDSGSAPSRDTASGADTSADTAMLIPGEDTASSGCSGADAIKINEILPNPASTDAGKEWVELYNAGTEAVDLSEWTLQWGTSSFSNEVALSGWALDPGGYLLIGGADVEGSHVVASLSLGNAGSSADAVRLVDCMGSPADTLIYGSPNSDEWADDTGASATSLANKPGDDESLGRATDGVDTDACADDFIVLEALSPGASNGSSGGGDTGDTGDTGTTPGTCETGGIKINEILPNPDGTDSGAEWVELYNPGTQDINIADWILEAGTSSYTSANTIEEDVTVPAGGFVLIGGPLVSDADYVTDVYLGNASTGADAVRLVDCEGGVQDTVLYGSGNSDMWLDDEGAVAESIATYPSEGLSIARLEDGQDTNQCGEDFGTGVPSPGESNASGTSSGDCQAGTKTVVINEYLPNPESDDTDREFVELFNAGTQTVQLGGWGIMTATREFDDTADFVFPAGATVAPGGFTVVAGVEIPEADFYLGEGNTFSLGNASTAPDGVQLIDCLATIQDIVLYGDAGDPAMDLGLSDELGAQTMATMPGENFSVGRFPDGVDSDNNEVDFFTNMPPSPGSENIRGGGAGGGEEGGCGCGSSKDPGGGEPAPSAAFAPVGLVIGMMSLAAVRRREDLDA